MDQEEDVYHELYLHEILEGKPELGVKGLLPLFEEFMALQKYNNEHVEQVRTFTNFLLARSKGEVPTGARFIRDFVLNHSAYK
jgi:glutamate--cysteine ligase catalytic subunit